MGNTNGAALFVFMDGLETAQAQREQPAPLYASSDVPDLVPIEEPEAVFTCTQKEVEFLNKENQHKPKHI
jgi:hypothetical protein